MKNLANLTKKTLFLGVLPFLPFLFLFPFHDGAIAAGLDQITCTTDCNAECNEKYPGFSNTLNRLECRGKCFDIIPSCMPPEDPSLDFLLSKVQNYRERLLTQFLSGEDNYSYVVSRDGNNQPKHKGDSLLWSSLAMGILPCEQGTAIQNSLFRSLQKRQGTFVRYEPLPANYEENPTSRDQETGVLFGLAMRSIRCPDHRQEIRAMWDLHRNFVEEQGRLCTQPHLNCRITETMSFLMKLLSYHLGLNTEGPSGNHKALFEAEMAASSAGIRISGQACYPIHLGTLQAITAEILGRPLKKRVYTQFCDDTEGMDLPLTDWYCKRNSSIPLVQWLNHFDNENPVEKPEYRYEYRHQRCGGRERPDMDEGDRSPGLDFLMLFHLARGWNLPR